MQSLTQIKESTVDGVIDARDKSSLVRTQEQCERRHLFRLRHPPDRLRLCELLEHLFFPAGIVFTHESFDERGINPCRRDAITANVVAHVVPRDGIGHRQHCTFAHGVGKAIGKSCRAGNRSQVQDHSFAPGLHVLDAAEHTVVNALHIHLEDTVKLFFSGIFQFADVCDTGVVHQNIDWLKLRDLVEDALDFCANTYIAGMRLRLTTCVANFRSDAFRVAAVHINDMHAGSMSGEDLRDRAANAASAAGDNCHLVIEPERPITPGPTHRETPLFHGIKSSWASDSALVCTSPLATRMMRSKIASPISSTVFSPEMIGPASMSMMSRIRCTRL